MSMVMVTSWRTRGPRAFHMDIAKKAGRLDIVETLENDVPKGAAAVRAYVNHGRWVASCECGGAEVVSSGDPFFMCLSCYNEADGGKLRRVLFPRNRSALEGVLLGRKEPGSRNWEVGETVADLKRQNSARGDR